MADDLAGLAREPYAALCTGWWVGGARFEVPLSLPPDARRLELELDLEAG